MNIMILCLFFFLQLFLFFSFGLLFFKITKLEQSSAGLVFFTGFVSFFCLFGIVAVPMILLSCPLSTLTYIIMVLSAIGMLLSLLFQYKQYPVFIKHIVTICREHSYMMVFLLITIGLHQLIVFTHIDQSADASYYIGKVSTDVFTNTMGHYDPYTGYPLPYLDARRLFACFPEFNAVISQFFDFHPLKQAKIVMPQILALLSDLLYYQIGMRLFHNHRKKAACLVCFTFLLDLYSYTIYTNSAFLLTRAYEGKSILANILIPGLFYCFLLLWKKEKQDIKMASFLLMTISFSSCIFSSSSMLIVPVALSAGMLPWIFREKQWKKLLLYLLCITPNLFVCIMYWLATKGYLVYPIGG